MGDSRLVREMWWEGDDLHIVYDDTGEEVKFVNAHFSEHESTPPDNSVVIEVPFPVNRIPFKMVDIDG